MFEPKSAMGEALRYIFFGNEKAARRLMVLYSLIAMCERHDVHPEACLTDVRLRLQDHPRNRLIERAGAKALRARRAGRIPRDAAVGIFFGRHDQEP